MKKCPYCAEEIKDAAIVCRYCGRDLPPTKVQANRIKTKASKIGKENETHTLRPIWQQSAIVTLVLTILYGIGAIINAPDQTTLAFWLTIRLVEVYITWFLIVVILIWLWRKFGVNFFGIVLFLVLIFTIYSLLRSNANLSLTTATNPTAAVERAIATIILNTPTPVILEATPTFSLQNFKKPKITYFGNECIRWLDAYPDYRGLRVCVYGNIVESQVELGQTRIYFSEFKHNLYLFDPNYEYLILPIGACVKAFGKIETDSNNVPYVELNGQLWEC